MTKKKTASRWQLGWVIARLRQQPKQSYISVNEIATGTSSPRNDKVDKPSLRALAFSREDEVRGGKQSHINVVIANEVKQSYLGVAAKRSNLTMV